jgi:hypothetical protein
MPLADQPKQGCDLAIVLDKQNKDAVALRNSPEEIDDRLAGGCADCCNATYLMVDIWLTYYR